MWPSTQCDPGKVRNWGTDSFQNVDWSTIWSWAKLWSRSKGRLKQQHEQLLWPCAFLTEGLVCAKAEHSTHVVTSGITEDVAHILFTIRQKSYTESIHLPLPSQSSPSPPSLSAYRKRDLGAHWMLSEKSPLLGSTNELLPHSKNPTPTLPIETGRAVQGSWAIKVQQHLSALGF